MKQEEERELYKRMLHHWGYGAQVMMAIEECSELIKVLSKRNRKQNGSTLLQVQEEIADVCIMMEQLKVIFCTENIEFVKQGKLERIKQIIDREEAVYD